MRSRALVGMILLLASACADPGTVEPSPDTGTAASGAAPTTTTPGRTTMTEPPDQPNDPTSGGEIGNDVLDLAIEEARLALADELGIDPDDIDVETAEEVTWPDTSLGCPQPGKSYAQQRTEGTHVVLKAKGAAYSYHGVAGGVPVVCDTPQIPPPIR